MHDPNTLAFHPFSWLEIWHVDPCKSGDDDSSGWFTPKLSEQDDKNIEGIIKGDLDANLTVKSNFEIVAWIWSCAKWRKFHKTRDLTTGEINYVISLATNTIDNLDYPIKQARQINSKRPTEQWQWLVTCIYKAMLRHNRKRWQHPRWHFWNWRIQITRPMRFAIGRTTGATSWD